MKQRQWFAGLFTVVMLACVVFLAWYIPAVSDRAFRLEDIKKSLETSQGRERKQQFEYDKVVAEIPEIQAELDLIRPQTEAAQQEAATLKAEKKKLRSEKKDLQKQLDNAAGQEGSTDE